VRHPPGTSRVIDRTVKDIQDHRPLRWWGDEKELYQATDPQQRHEVWRHRRAGRQKAPWELPLVLGLGPEWRKTCEATSKLEWRALTLDAIRALSVAWSLPEVPDKPSKTKQKLERQAKAKPKPKGRPRRKPTPAKLTPKRAELPTPESWAEYLQEEVWSRPHGCLKHIVDSELVAGWVNGHTKFLEGPTLDALGSTTLEVAAALTGLWRTDHNGLACEWRKRERNVEADWACNASLDMQTNFVWMRETPSPETNIILYSDGALRSVDNSAPGRAVAAFGWAIRKFTDKSSLLIAMGATIVRDPDITVPHLEFLGVRAAKQHLLAFARGHSPVPMLHEVMITNGMLMRFLNTTGEPEVDGQV